jgi:hypothetical protein
MSVAPEQANCCKGRRGLRSIQLGRKDVCGAKRVGHVGWILGFPPRKHKKKLVSLRKPYKGIDSERGAQEYVEKGMYIMVVIDGGQVPSPK